MAKYLGGQSSRFDGIVQDVAKAKPPVWKVIDPDSDILRNIKKASPNTVTIVRVYTGMAGIGSANDHPDPRAYGREYAALVYAKVSTPQYADFIETENEPQDYSGIGLSLFIQRLNLFLIGFAERAKELGFKPIGPNFSVGYPEVYVKNTNYGLWPNAWQGLVEGLRALKAAEGAMGLHEYGWPQINTGWSDSMGMGYLTGRCLAIYKCLPQDLQDLPLYLTEYGIDALLVGQQGGFWHGRDDSAVPWLADQMRQAWTQIYSKVPQLRGTCFFVHGNNNATLWAEYDTCRTDTSRQAFVNLMAEELPDADQPPIQGDSVPTQTEMLNAVWNSIGKGMDFAGIAYNPTAAFVAEAIKRKLGPPTGNEGRKEIGVTKYAFQAFRDAFLWCKEGDWSNIAAYDLLTAEPFMPTTQPPVISPPPPTSTPYVFPASLTSVGAFGEEGKRTPNQPFYRLMGATVRQGVSAFLVVTVFGKTAPAIGAKVVNLFPDGNGEVIQTDGTGTARFQFAATSAFTEPGTGPFTVFVADESAFKDFDSVPKHVSFQFKLSDIVHSLGDFRGEHTEIYLQFQEQN